MELLVCVINDPSRVDEILEGFLEIGITGATIVDSYGMGRTLIQDVPLFAGFRNLLSGPSKYNKTIFSVIDSKEKLTEGVAIIENILGDLSSPATGIVFTIPIDFVKGLSKEL